MAMIWIDVVLTYTDKKSIVRVQLGANASIDVSDLISIVDTFLSCSSLDNVLIPY